MLSQVHSRIDLVKFKQKIVSRGHGSDGRIVSKVFAVAPERAIVGVGVGAQLSQTISLVEIQRQEDGGIRNLGRQSAER